MLPHEHFHSARSGTHTGYIPGGPNVLNVVAEAKKRSLPEEVRSEGGAPYCLSAREGSVRGDEEPELISAPRRGRGRSFLQSAWLEQGKLQSS